VVTHPASIATTAPAPDTATARRNQAVWGSRRRRHHTIPNQAASSSSAVPMPTMVL
jgi:hypothetical protein